MTQKDLLENVLRELVYIKEVIPSSELKQVILKVEEIKMDVSELTNILMHPETGLIVKINENSKYRHSKVFSAEDKTKIQLEVKEIIQWKEGVNKALWIAFTALVALAVKILFFPTTTL